MTYKSILLHLHDPNRAQAPSRVAAALAREMGAHLVGLGVVPPYVVLPVMDGVGASISVDEHRTSFKSDLKRLAAIFAEATSALSPPAEWREGDAQFGTVADVVLDQGRSLDLIVAAAPERGKSHTALFEDPLRLVMESGRPVLLVPNGDVRSVPPRRVLVAWNGRREATRAVFDAMPLLERAGEVAIVCIDPDRTSPAVGDLPGTDIATALARHGVRCQIVEASSSAGDVGHEIARQASAFGADLLVMGCYGHSRVREFLLGGASRDILANVTLPVLMSH